MGVAARPAARWASIAAITSASMPTPALIVNQCECSESLSVGVKRALPSPTEWLESVRSDSRIMPVASIASLGNPSARAMTFAEPPGMVASIARSSPPEFSKPLTTSLMVPSPPRVIRRSRPRESPASFSA